MFSPLLLGVMGLGGMIFLTGVVIANIAVIEMSKRLNGRYKTLRQKRWWEVIGHGSSLVINEYRQLGWQDETPNNRLRLGYKFIAGGLATVVGSSLMGNYLRGSF
jgi:hypothetical protein